MAKHKNKNRKPHPHKPQPQPQPQPQPEPQPEAPTVGASVIATVQVFNVVPPQQVFVLTDGTTIASQGTSGQLVADLRDIIVDALAGPPPVDPITPEPPQETPPPRDEDGNAPEDYTALEGSDIAPIVQNVSIHIPDGVDPEAIQTTIQTAIQTAVDRLAKTPEEGQPK